MFIVILTGIVNASSHKICVSLSNQKCDVQPTLLNIHLNEYNQELHCDPFAIKLDRCIGSSNTLNDLSKKLCVPSKTRFKT